MKRCAKQLIVTVIMPVYNTDSFLLQNSIESVLKQSFGNIELLIINDGSTNSDTIRVLDKYRGEKRVRLIDSANSGVSSARNKGLQKAKGDYIVFMDSDDYLNERYVEKMLKTLEENNCKIAFSKIIKIYDGRTISEHEIKYTRAVFPENIEIFLNDDWLFTCQGGIFDAKIAKSERFNTKQSYAEDTDYSIRIIRNNAFAYSRDSNYYYVQNESSAIHVVDRKKVFDYIVGCYAMLDTVSSIYPEYKTQIVSLKADKLYKACSKLVRCFVNYKLFYDFVEKYSSKEYFRFTEYDSVKMKIKKILLAHAPFALYLLFRFKLLANSSQKKGEV